MDWRADTGSTGRSSVARHDAGACSKQSACYHQLRTEVSGRKRHHPSGRRRLRPLRRGKYRRTKLPGLRSREQIVCTMKGSTLELQWPTEVLPSLLKGTFWRGCTPSGSTTCARTCVESLLPPWSVSSHWRLIARTIRQFLPLRKRLLALDDLHDGAYEALIRSAATRGARREAFGYYKRYETALDEYGAGPTRRISELIEKVRSGEEIGTNSRNLLGVV